MEVKLPNDHNTYNPQRRNMEVDDLRTRSFLIVVRVKGLG